MPAISTSAPGKIILLGEHSVVYGKPAIAVPVTQVKTRAIITANPRDPYGTVTIDAPDIQMRANLNELPVDNPLKVAVIGVLEELEVATPPALTIRITSTIPIASGLGSGAAVSVALIRSLSTYLGKPLPVEKVSQLAYRLEQIYHGTPSGIDNTVIAYNQPIFFIRNQPILFLEPRQSFTIIIGDTGLQSSTAKVVGDLRLRVQADPSKYEKIFDEMAAIAFEGKNAVEQGNLGPLGQLMTHNHHLLQELKVSSTELDRLVDAALAAGALGAKLSGGGWGGNMIALVDESQAEIVIHALQIAGATHIIKTVVAATQPKV